MVLCGLCLGLACFFWVYFGLLRLVESWIVYICGFILCIAYGMWLLLISAGWGVVYYLGMCLLFEFFGWCCMLICCLLLVVLDLLMMLDFSVCLLIWTVYCGEVWFEELVLLGLIYVFLNCVVPLVAYWL